eukprot:TRINITY_DN4786_c1_g5_i1.p1 TRINITY_DN4786_c1_g5~~TRINITY_DN4786_c1_g5_i1.p1  ORF type:complete len:300 (+),score=35.64 TRINITY_DN4786_c1_g5_i1:80-979(+)
MNNPLLLPDIRFWSKRPFEKTLKGVEGLASLGDTDDEAMECSKVTLSERARRETILHQEHKHRVHLVKETIYTLHLLRTDKLAHTTKSFLIRTVVQADTSGTYGMGIIAMETIGMEEEKERMTLEEHEYASRVFLMDKAWPTMLKVARSLFMARHGINVQEQEKRFDIWQEEEEAFSVLDFQRSAFRHTESVVTQLSREDTRIAAISHKMIQLGYRSLKKAPIHPPTLHQDAQHPVPVYRKESGESITSTLKADCEFIEAHLEGLRTLRTAEEDKIQDAQDTLQRLNRQIEERRRFVEQ